MGGHVPTRTCIGCRRRVSKFELIRLVAVSAGDGRIRAELDRAGTMPGRGAYLCRERDSDRPLSSCMAQATRRGTLARALRAPVALDPENVESVGR